MADDDQPYTSNALAGIQNPFDAIDAAATRYGLNPAVLKGIASIESSMNPESNRNRGTQYKGLFQIGQDEWRRYGRGDIYNPADNADAAARMLADHARWFADRQGREPTPGDLYMMHLQGRGFIQNGTMTNVAGNPYPGMRGPQTPDTFARGWIDELGRRMARYGGASSIYANGDATQPQGNTLQSQGNQAAQSAIPSPLTSTSSPLAPSPLAPPTGGVQSALAGLGSSDNKGTGTFADIGKQLMAQAGKTQGLPFPDAKLKPFDENLRPLPLNLPNFAAMAQIPKFAEGGIVDRPTVAMVGENGPEAIVPLSAMVGSGATSDPFAAAAARIRAPYTRAVQYGPHTGLTDIARYFGEQGRSVATAPLRALTGQMQVTDPETGMPTPEAMREGQSFAGTVMTGAIPFAERGAAGIFGGRLARGANLSELEAAKTFAEHGAHPDDIWRSTGWFQGADKQWRHEIPDTLAQFDKGAPSSGKLPQLMPEHPLLYAAYPELKNASYRIVPGETSSYNGLNAAGQHEFEIGHRTLERDPSVVLHEIQHAIQGKEGFAKGGSPERGPFSTPFDAELEPLIKERIALIRKYVNPGGVEPTPLTPKENERLNYLNKVGETHGRLQRAYNQEAFRNYQRLAGETEARNVQGRFETTPDVHPQLTESFPRSEQIVSDTASATGPKMVRNIYARRMVESTERGFDPFNRHPFNRPPPPDLKGAFDKLLAATRSGSSGPINPRSEPGSIFEALGAKSPASAIAPAKILGAVEKLQPGKGNYVSIEKLKAELPSITDKHIIELADQGKLELAPYGGSGAGQHFVTDSQGNRYIGVALVGRPKSEERIGFTSAGAQRGLGKVPAERTQPAMETPEAMAKRKAEMKAAFDELMKKGKPEKTKVAPSAPGRIGFKSLGTER